jgi:hypothetical protein
MFRLVCVLISALSAVEGMDVPGSCAYLQQEQRNPFLQYRKQFLEGVSDCTAISILKQSKYNFFFFLPT